MVRKRRFIKSVQEARNVMRKALLPPNFFAQVIKLALPECVLNALSTRQDGLLFPRSARF